MLRSSGGKRNAITYTLQVDPAPSAHLRPLTRKKGNSTLSYQEKIISLENKKLDWLIRQGEENEEDLNFFRSLVP